MATRKDDNLASLAHLTEETILSSLHERYNENNIYTYVGDILIAVNPYQRLPMYGEDVRQKYMGHDKSMQPPHIYQIADRAYEQMVQNKSDQCFVISGESGAGKTETTKFIVSHIIELCKAGNSSLEQNIKKLNPLLEAFGNAKTVMNNNSSRFGKYLELKFDKNGAVCGGSMRHYLLEKSRLATRNDNEQNFHIFYQMYAGLDQEGKLGEYGLSVPSSHRYLHGTLSDDDVMSDRYREEWEEVMDGLTFVGFEKGDINGMLACLSAVLLLGDTEFQEAGNVGVKISSDAARLEKACELLEISYKQVQQAMVSLEIVTRGEVVLKQYDLDSAADNRDAMTKAIYNRLFSWLVKGCNKIMGESDVKSNTNLIALGLLDIFGFECFKNNSLEQLCINITNEQLQNYFNQHIFVMEQEEYKNEGVDFSQIPFMDNQPTLDMFLKKPQGLFAILDEESKFPKATDLSFTEKCVNYLGKHPSDSFAGPRSNRDLHFKIKHYAGEVMYQTLHFLEKNRDSLSKDVWACMQDSKRPFAAALFDANADGARKSTQGTNARQSTLTGGFKSSLADLVVKLNSCQPFFVRCLKPNEKQAASMWDEELVQRQLRYAGVLETIKIRKLGYSYRLSFEDFVTRFKMLAFRFDQEPPISKETCGQILKTIKLKDFQIGKSKVFMKYFHVDILSDEATKYTSALILLQRGVKAHVAKQKYLPLLQAKRRQDKQVVDFLSSLETYNAKSITMMQKISDEDDRENEKRDWMDRVKESAVLAEAEKMRQEEERKKLLAAAEREPKKVKSKSVNGYAVWKRNMHLTLRVGKLKAPWKKRFDEESQRFFFKNTEKRTTTWIDPRSYEILKHDALDTVDDELPYGWEEAEAEDGTIFYIDHISNTHHHEHPRIELQEKIAAFHQRLATNNEKGEEILTSIKELRAKRQRIHQMFAAATDGDSRNHLQERLDALDKVLEKRTTRLEQIRTENKTIERAVEVLRKGPPAPE